MERKPLKPRCWKWRKDVEDERKRHSQKKNWTKEAHDLAEASYLDLGTREHPHLLNIIKQIQSFPGITKAKKEEK